MEKKEKEEEIKTVGERGFNVLARELDGIKEQIHAINIQQQEVIQAVNTLLQQKPAQITPQPLDDNVPSELPPLSEKKGIIKTVTEAING